MSIKKIIGIIFFIFVLFGASRFVYATSNSLLVSNTSNSKIGGDLLVLLLEIKSIELRGDIFNEKSFSNLKDFGVEIAPQPSGRDNPFASIQLKL